MARGSVSLALLSLFTTNQRAAEIEGDLIERLPGKGRLWFAWHVLHTSMHLFRATVARSPLTVTLMSYALYELMAKAHVLGIRPLRIHLLYGLDLPRFPALIPIYLLLILLPFAIGMAVVRWLPSIGASVAVGVLAFGYARVAVLDESYTALQVTIYAALPMMLGAFCASWLQMSTVLVKADSSRRTRT